jgi:hypothetical protein
LTVLKTIIPKAREAGEKARAAREANAIKLLKDKKEEAESKND